MHLHAPGSLVALWSAAVLIRLLKLCIRRRRCRRMRRMTSRTTMTMTSDSRLVESSSEWKWREAGTRGSNRSEMTRTVGGDACCTHNPEKVGPEDMKIR